jgi:hypothetical protein
MLPSLIAFAQVAQRRHAGARGAPVLLDHEVGEEIRVMAARRRAPRHQRQPAR